MQVLELELKVFKEWQELKVIKVVQELTMCQEGQELCVIKEVFQEGYNLYVEEWGRNCILGEAKVSRKFEIFPDHQ